jgi:hypothetical protein
LFAIGKIVASQRAPHGRVLGFGTALHERGADESGARGTVCRGLQEHESIRVTGIDVVLPQQRRLLVSFKNLALKRLQEGHAQTDVARLLNVSQPTISRLLGDRPFEASAGDAAQP